MATAHEPIILNADGRSLGRIATEAATLLRGKTHPEYQPHILPTQKVIITNAARVRVTGNKMLKGKREKYSGYPGGLKMISYQATFDKSPSKFIIQAIEGMIPRNRLRKEILKNLSVYATDQK
ncbi:MAG: 50S ribosomal protein L13 [Patescibacteria group bacterium]